MAKKKNKVITLIGSDSIIEFLKHYQINSTLNDNTISIDTPHHVREGTVHNRLKDHIQISTESLEPGDQLIATLNDELRGSFIKVDVKYEYTAIVHDGISLMLILKQQSVMVLPNGK